MSGLGLAAQTADSGPATNAEVDERQGANQAGLSGPTVHLQMLLKGPPLTASIVKVSQGGPTALDGSFKNLNHGAGQSTPSCLREFEGPSLWMDAGTEEGLGRVDVAEPSNSSSIKQPSLDRPR